MKKILVYTILFCLLASISFDANCQLRLSPQKQLLINKLTFTLPRSLYFEPSVKSFSLLNTVKAQLNLYPENQFQKSQSRASFFNSNSVIKELYLKKQSLAIGGKAPKIGSNELFDFYKLPLDNMICEVPNNNTKFYSNLYDPTVASDYPADNMPNALPKYNPIK